MFRCKPWRREAAALFIVRATIEVRGRQGARAAAAERDRLVLLLAPQEPE